MIKPDLVIAELKWQVKNILKPLWDKFVLPAPDEIQVETIVVQNITICRFLWSDLQKYIEIELDVYRYPGPMLAIDETFMRKVAALQGYFLDVNEIKDCQLLLGRK